MQAAAQTRSQQNTSKKNANNIWQWLVASWKKPFAAKPAESWFGWLTLLIENILFVLGLYICINKYVGQYTGGDSPVAEAAHNMLSNFSTSVLLEFLLYFLLMIVAVIALAFFARKFVYGKNDTVLALVNRIVSI